LLGELSLHHQNELRMQGPALIAALKRVMHEGSSVAAAAREAREKASRTGHKNGRTRTGRR
jgi:hypothetical protein